MASWAKEKNNMQPEREDSEEGLERRRRPTNTLGFVLFVGYISLSTSF